MCVGEGGAVPTTLNLENVPPSASLLLNTYTKGARNIVANGKTRWKRENDRLVTQNR